MFVFCALPLVVLLNFFFKTKIQNFSILSFSLAFLFWVCSVKTVFLLLLVSFLTQMAAVFLCKLKSSRFRFLVCWAFIFFVLVLVFFEFNFVFAKAAYNLFFDFEKILFSLVCMANISYLIDIYKNYVSLQKSFVNFLTYVFMFPKLFLGPALPYYQFERQLINRKMNFALLNEGVECFIVGFAKKVVLANEFYEIYEFVISQTSSSLPVITAWLGAFSGFLSLVFNFSGYGDMAVGLGKMLGFNLPFNVKKLRLAGGVSEFFKNFNCSVLTYFKYYIFPWWNNSFLICRFVKLILIGFFLAVFFGACVESFVAFFYFFIIIFLERFLNGIFVVDMLKNAIKVLNLVLLLIGTVLLQKCGIIYNLNYLGSMFGTSGILIDFSFIFWVMCFKFLIIVFVLFLLSFFKRFFMKIKIFSFVWNFRFFGLIVLFLFSVLLSLSQI